MKVVRNRVADESQSRRSCNHSFMYAIALRNFTFTYLLTYLLVSRNFKLDLQ